MEPEDEEGRIKFKEAGERDKMAGPDCMYDTEHMASKPCRCRRHRRRRRRSLVLLHSTKVNNKMTGQFA